MKRILKNISIAPKSWMLKNCHPETNKKFSAEWIGLYLNNIHDGQFWNGTSDSDLFSISFNSKVNNLELRIVDFIEYETKKNKKIIIGTNRDIELEKYILALLENKKTIRKKRNDNILHLVHSTSKESWNRIKMDWKLKSINQLEKEKYHLESVGQKHLGDPKEFLDYIHFSPYDSIHTEYVVLSRQRNKITTKENELYSPGARIYLDKSKMDRDRKIIYDGLHYAKVKDELDLEKYMVYYVEGQKKFANCTARQFFDYATSEFENRIGTI